MKKRVFSAKHDNNYRKTSKTQSKLTFKQRLISDVKVASKFEFDKATIRSKQMNLFNKMNETANTITRDGSTE